MKTCLMLKNVKLLSCHFFPGLLAFLPNCFLFFFSKPLVRCCAVAMGSTPGGAVFVTVAGKGQSVTFLATSASIFTAADTESASWAPAPATQAIKETTVKKVRDTNQTPVLL